MEELIKKRGRGRPKKTEKETAVEVKENLSRAREEFYAVAGGLGVGIGQMIKFIAEKKGIGYDDSEFWRERWANNTQILAGTFVGGGLKYLPHLNFLMAFVLPFYAQAGQVLKTSPRVVIPPSPSEEEKIEESVQETVEEKPLVVSLPEK